MINKLTALVVAVAFVFNAATAFADTKVEKAAKQTNALAALLPASDAVAVVDMKRVLNEAAPQILSGKPEMLAEINRVIDDIREKTGLDLRQFEQVAVGVSIKNSAAQSFELEPVALVRGKYSAGALIALGKLASNGKYREERVGDRTIYIFSGKDIADKNKPQTNNSKADPIDRMVNNLMKEFAVASYDGNTLAFGTVARVRETFQSKTRASAEVLSLINRKPTATMSFGVQLPSGLASFVKLDNDEIGKSLNAIRQVSGAIEIADNNATLSLAAKTATADTAQSLKEQLEGLQIVGKAFLGGAKGADKQVFVRMIDNARISRTASEVMLDLQVPQSDINILLGVK